MSGPITWRNVTAPAGVAEAGALFQGAQRSFTGAFDTLGTLLKQREATAAANVDVGNENQKQAFLNTLQGAKTPEELAAMQSQIDAQFAGLNPANQAATRAAQELRQASLRTQTMQAQQYQTQQTEFANKSPTEAAAAIAATGDMTKLQEFLSQNKVNNPAALLQAGTAAQRAAAQHTFAVNTDARAQQLAPGALTLQEANIAQTKAQAAKLKAEADAAPGEQANKAQDRVLKEHGVYMSRVQENMEKQRKLSGGGSVGAPDGLSNVLKTLSQSVDKAAMHDLGKYVAQALNSDPAFKNIPVSEVARIALAHASDGQSWYSRSPVGSMAAEFKKVAGAPSPEASKEYQDLQNLINRDKLMADGLMEKAIPGFLASSQAALVADQAKIAAAENIPPGSQPTEAPKGQPVVTPAMVKKEEDGVAELVLKQEQAEVSLGLRKGISKESQDFLADKQKREDAGVRAFMESMGAAAKKFSPLGDAIAAPGAALANLVGANQGDPGSLISRAVGGVSLRDSQVAKVQADRKNLERILADSQAKKAK